jgi:hypothetical protein
MINSTSSPKQDCSMCLHEHPWADQSQSPTILFSIILSLQWLDLNVFLPAQKCGKIYTKYISKYYSKRYSTAVLQKCVKREGLLL